MKKKLLIASCLSAWFFAKSQLTYVGNDALMHVEDQALVYSGGGIKLAGTSKVNNIGDIMMVTSSESFETETASDFRLKYVDPTTYGQFYIQDTPQANITGKVNKEYVEPAHGSASRQQVALPFFGLTVDNLKSILPYINTTNSALSNFGRWNPRSIFKWNNSTSAFDQITGTSASVGNPTDYYILSRRNFDGTIAWNPAVTAENDLTSTDNIAGTGTSAAATAVNTKKKIFNGTPVSDVSGVTTVTLSGAPSTTSTFGTGGENVNSYKEKYNSYINDPFVTGSWTDSDFGLNIYQFGNPFLTNIDLSMVKTGTTSTDDDNAISNLNGISYYVSGITNSSSGTTYSSSVVKKITFDSNNLPVAGTENDLIIKPMQEFILKLTSNTSQTLKFNKTRRFAQTARSTSTTYSVNAARSASTPVVTKQLEVSLLNANDEEIGKTYYVVNSVATTGHAPETARMQATAEASSALFTQEEVSTGGADVNTNYKLYINEANEINYQGKQISLVVNNESASKLKFRLIENAKPVQENRGLSNGKSFYFESNGTFTKLNSGTVIPLSNGTASFGLYYDQPAGSFSTNELVRSETVIAKNNSDYVVRFNRNWKTADIEVYSAAGQLVFNAKKVSTTSDYVLPLNSSVNALYVVKVISEKGEVVTKKVIK